MELVRPAPAMLPAYRDALERGFSPHNVNSETVRLEQLALIDNDPEGLIAMMDDPEGRGPPIARPDGSLRPRLPGITRWMWENAQFIGAINLRWQAGTSALPPDVPGHIGYTVCEWHRGGGHATKALLLMLEEARARGLKWVDLTAEDTNRASCRTIEKAGGRVIGRFDAGDLHHPCANTLLHRIEL